MRWIKLCNSRELQLVGTLNGGQSFRWTQNKETEEWTGVFSKTVWKLRQKDDSIEYQVLGSLLTNSLQNKSAEEETIFKSLLEKYFRLDVDLASLYKQWSENDELFRSACQQFYGIRMLNQEPEENLFSFICSQNNSISRITGMIHMLCRHYGEEICKDNDIIYYAFPNAEKLAHPRVESHLRQLSFGYRAGFLQKSAAKIVELGGEKWFKVLEDMKFEQARDELMKLPGIGPKVADCICLMSLKHLQALPVDTHVFQIAQHYLPHLKRTRNLNKKIVYEEIGSHFRKLFGDKAGWAHTILFCADLKKFQSCNGVEKAKEVPAKKKKKS